MQICKLEDIPLGTTRGFAVGDTGILITRSSFNVIKAYLNRCPHLGVPLNWEKDQFMDSDALHLRCATHGALFEPDTGLCIMGPCRGDSLWSLDCCIKGEHIHIDDDDLPPPPSSSG